MIWRFEVDLEVDDDLEGCELFAKVSEMLDLLLDPEGERWWSANGCDVSDEYDEMFMFEAQFVE